MPARPLSQISPVGPHQRWASRTCCAVGAALLSFLLVLGAAQAGDLLPGTVAEKEALATLEAGKNIRAREQAEAILEDEDSFIATFVRAEVYFTEEANLARALFLMRKAEDMLLDAYSTPPEDREAVRWHKKVLMEDVWILAEMDDREGQLAVLERKLQVLETPLLAPDLDPAGATRDDADAGAVVAAVLERAQPLHQDAGDVLHPGLGDPGPDDPAHDP